ncbi:MAG: DoxX family protein [Myxococcota bacterium]|nr:DoxX family protein [Myxococcota bacterium]
MKRFFMNPGNLTGVASVGVLVLRLVSGVLMLYLHGWPKWTKFSAKADSFPDPLGVGPPVSMALTIFAEVGCSALIVLGAFTRWAAFVLMFTMVIAAFVIHGEDPLRKQELALIYAAVFAGLVFTGAGRISIDNALGMKSD